MDAWLGVFPSVMRITFYFGQYLSYYRAYILKCKGIFLTTFIYLQKRTDIQHPAFAQDIECRLMCDT
jgi:hypothetical protein